MPTSYAWAFSLWATGVWRCLFTNEGCPRFFMRIREQRQGDTDRNLKLKIKNNAKSSTNPCRHPDAWLML